MKKLAILAVMLLLVSCGETLTIEPPAPESFTRACADAKTVVLAEVEALGEASGEGDKIRTPVTLTLAECYSENYFPCDTLTASLPAGKSGGTTLSCGFTLDAGETYLLYLDENAVITGGVHVQEFTADYDAWELAYKPLIADEIYAEYDSLGALEWEAHLWSDDTVRAKRVRYEDLFDAMVQNRNVLAVTVTEVGEPYLEEGYEIDSNGSYSDNEAAIRHIRTPITLSVDTYYAAAEEYRGDLEAQISAGKKATFTMTQDHGTVDGFTARIPCPYLAEGRRYLLITPAFDYVDPMATVELTPDGGFRAYCDYGIYDEYEDAAALLEAVAECVK